jgi:hypothetical protein
MSTQTQQPEARSHIEEVRHRYGRALDQRDWALFASLFADEVEADFSAFGIPAGRVPRAAVVEVMKHSFRRDAMKSHQLYGNFEIVVEGDAATSLASLVGRHLLPGFEGGDSFTLHARYHDRLVRTPQGWRISATRLEVLFMEGNLAIVG